MSDQPKPQVVVVKRGGGCMGCLLLAILLTLLFGTGWIVVPLFLGVGAVAVATTPHSSSPSPRPGTSPVSIAASTPSPAPTPDSTPITAPTPFVPTRLKVEVSAKLEYGLAHLKKGTPVEVLKTEIDGWTVRAQGVEFHVTRDQVE